MAIYHFQAKVISRSTGRSVVAASAYASCQIITNQYDGITHDYTNKGGHVYSEVLLPKNAPKQWEDRAVLWNAVEEIEKTKDSRLAREIVVALPIELSVSEHKELLRNFLKSQCVDEGMCADYSIHEVNKYNPHAHILLTLRPIDEKGKWEAKTKKEYLCKKDEIEKAFTSEEFIEAKKQGFEKQYQYKLQGEKEYLTPTQAKLNPSLIRVSKSPKSTRFGRQNPTCEKWNSEEQIVMWRKAWQECVNLALEQSGSSNRVDHRSHYERGLIEKPTVHEGYNAINIERDGHISNRCELNRQIRHDNMILKDLNKTIIKLKNIINESVSTIAEELENIRISMIYIQYQILSSKKSIDKKSKIVNTKLELIEEYKSVKKLISDKKTQRNILLEKRKRSFINPLKLIEINKQLTTVNEEINELTNDKSMILSRLNCKNIDELKSLVKDVKLFQNDIIKLKNFKEKLYAKKADEIELFESVQKQVHESKSQEVQEKRMELRIEKLKDLKSKLKDAFAERFEFAYFKSAIEEVDRSLNEKSDDYEKITVLGQLRQKSDINKCEKKVKSKDLER